MSEIIIRITVPEGVTVAVEGARTVPAPLRLGEASTDRCPEHHLPWKHVPAGVSKKTGKPYNAFWACPEMGCNLRPALAWKPPTAPVEDIDDPFDWIDEPA